MTEQDLIKFKELSMQDGRLNLQWFAEYVAQAEREAIAQMVEDAPALVDFAKNEKGGCMVCGFTPKMAATAIRARGES